MFTVFIPHQIKNRSCRFGRLECPLPSKPRSDVIAVATHVHGHAGASEFAANDLEQLYNEQHHKPATATATDNPNQTGNNSSVAATLLDATVGTTFWPRFSLPTHESKLHSNKLQTTVNIAKGKEKLRPALKIQTSQNPNGNPVANTQTQTHDPNNQAQTRVQQSSQTQAHDHQTHPKA
ncbi:hypothetical protein WN943_012899 [Citrus x changshan-huyou]